MITDYQIRRMREAMNREKTLEQAAVVAGMDVRTARKYKSGKLPSEMKPVHVWRTRKDPFEKTWSEILPFLERSPEVDTHAFTGVALKSKFKLRLSCVFLLLHSNVVSYHRFVYSYR